MSSKLIIRQSWTFHLILERQLGQALRMAGVMEMGPPMAMVMATGMGMELVTETATPITQQP